MPREWRRRSRLCSLVIAPVSTRRFHRPSQSLYSTTRARRRSEPCSSWTTCFDATARPARSTQISQSPGGSTSWYGPPLVGCDFDPTTFADGNSLQRLERLALPERYIATRCVADDHDRSRGTTTEHVCYLECRNQWFDTKGPLTEPSAFTRLQGFGPSSRATVPTNTTSARLNAVAEDAVPPQPHASAKEGWTKAATPMRTTAKASWTRMVVTNRRPGRQESEHVHRECPRSVVKDTPSRATKRSGRLCHSCAMLRMSNAQSSVADPFGEPRSRSRDRASPARARAPRDRADS